MKALFGPAPDVYVKARIGPVREVYMKNLFEPICAGLVVHDRERK